MARKYPSELDTRTIRINAGVLIALRNLSQRLGVTMAETLRLAIAEKAKEEQTLTPMAQSPLIVTPIAELRRVEATQL